MSKPMQKPPIKKGVLVRVFKYLLAFYPVLLPTAGLFIVLSAFVSAIPAIFTKRVLEVITSYASSGNTDYLSAIRR